MSGKQTKEEAWRHFLDLLESPDINAFRELAKAVEDAKEPWIVESLIDFYTSSDSPRALELIASCREQEKVICKKLHDCFEESSRRRAALRLLVSLISRQPSWLSKLIKEKIFNDCIRCLKSETDAPALMYATYAITMLLPVAPDTMASYLKEVLDVFVRVVNVAYSSHNSMPEVYQLNLQVGLHSLFVRLYGMYPWSLLTCLQQHCSKPENKQLCMDAMEPMFQQVRLHPLLVTSSPKDKEELSRERWRGKEAHDIVADCSAFALDVSEGTYHATASAASTLPSLRSMSLQDISLSPAGAGTVAGNSSPRHVERGLFKVQSTNSMEPAADSLIAAAAASASFFSPSENFSFTTPLNVSHSTTPTLRCCPGGSVYEGDESYQTYSSKGMQRVNSASFYNSSAAGTPSTHRHVTPQASATPGLAQTPVASDVAVNANAAAPSQISRRHSSGGAGGKGQGKELPVAPLSLVNVEKEVAALSRSGSRSDTVPPSPHRKEFTSEPPADAVKALACHVKVQSDAATAAGDSFPAASLPPKRDDCSLSVKSLQQLLEKLSDSTSHGGSEMDDTVDEEVSSINQPVNGSVPAQVATVTAESVAAFMKTVNRIRFNSTTVVAGMSVPHISGSRPKSCPSFPIGESDTLAAVPTKAQDDGDIGCGRQGAAAIASMQHGSAPVPLLSEDVPVAASATKPHQVTAQSAKAQQAQLSTAHQIFLAAPTESAMQINDNSVEGVDTAARQTTGLSHPSSSELLDDYLRQGIRLHIQLQNRLSLTDQMSTKWTHFGGSPPADEMAILQGQLLMMHTQLLYERQKRDQHSLRNRRLLREVTKTVALKEQNEALGSQVQDLGMDVFNLNSTISRLKEELKKQKHALMNSEEQHSQQLAKEARRMEELEYTHKDLQRRFDAQHMELSSAKKELAEIRRRLQHVELDLRMAGEQVDNVTALEGEVQSLKKQLLLMGEVQIKYEERLAAAAALPQHTCSRGGRTCSLTPGGAPVGIQQQLISDIDRLKGTVAYQLSSLEQAQRTIEQLQQTANTKDNAIAELKRMLEHVKAVHAGHIQAVEDKCSMMRTVCQALEQHTVDLYAQIAYLTPPPPLAPSAAAQAHVIGGV